MVPMALVAGLVAAAGFAATAYVDNGLWTALAFLLVLLVWRAWSAQRALVSYLQSTRIDRAAALGRFRRVPVGAALACVVLGFGVPLFARWTGVEGSVTSFLRGHRTIEYADDPAMFWFVSACWYAVSAMILWFAVVFAWTIERIRREPRRFLEILAQR
jgi:hypothetical protein